MGSVGLFIVELKHSYDLKVQEFRLSCFDVSRVQCGSFEAAGGSHLRCIMGGRGDWISF